jgi:hypothetical protein
MNVRGEQEAAVLGELLAQEMIDAEQRSLQGELVKAHRWLREVDGRILQ